jgi:hypothetical protein
MALPRPSWLRVISDELAGAVGKRLRHLSMALGFHAEAGRFSFDSVGKNWRLDSSSQVQFLPVAGSATLWVRPKFSSKLARSAMSKSVMVTGRPRSARLVTPYF